MNREVFLQELTNLGITFNKEMLDKLELYVEFLLEYNSHINLTAIKTKEEVYLKHFYDSLTLCKIVDLTKEGTLLDIGSGAGFPGMVIKIFFPHLQVFLVDSNNKKTKFLDQLKQKLNVDNLEVINNRIENITSRFLNSIDIITARAVTNMPVLTELAMPLVKKDKYFIAMKGSNKEEIKNAYNAIKVMNGVIDDIQEFELPNNAGERTLIKIKKAKETNISKLRSYEKIIKKPL